MSFRCLHCLVVTSFRLAFSCLASRILRIWRIELIAVLDSKLLWTYMLINYSSGLAVLSFIDVNFLLLTSTKGAKHPLHGTSSPMMIFSENLRSSTSAMSRSLPRIISYPPLVDSYTYRFHVTIFVALNSGKQESMFTFF